LRPDTLPWPGQVPPPAPTRVFAEPWSTAVVGPGGQPVAVTERGTVTCEPTRFAVPASGGGGSVDWQPVEAWAGPWPVDEQWWEAPSVVEEVAQQPPRNLVARFQVVGADGRAWLMRCEGTRWVTEAAYD
jgi:protein ImuB